jgi:3-isopropylmalate/(R)-2-methylmalate dehydratase small subunit
LEANGFKAVIAPSFARIFRQNMFNRGLLALEIEEGKVDRLFRIKNQIQNCEIDLNKKQIRFDNNFIINFSIEKFAEQLVRKGGLVGFLIKNY